ncbi:hypothetical protein KPL35_02960 [Clostridium sp. CF011]|uniref:hypothetical protein n=1 Tax=Clostridium sp. CF011 TaxID=2843318 RepID=UPI001C0C1C89|nr:hypothetical protein [Clostridium sp. CF011]MBU3091036.1 hypothetical protein [Clostridium sp. CF011]WAG69045.1 hypothetical protein LL036_13545 [Clostridium sp. CF011]
MKVYKLLSLALVVGILIPFTTGCSASRSTVNMIPYLGCMQKNIKSKSSSNTVITLDLKKGDKVKFKYGSNVKEGTLKIQLTRSKDEVIEDFPIGKSGTKELLIDKDGSCLLSADFENFIGDYNIYVDKIK